MPNRKKSKIIISSYDDLGNPFYGGGGAYAIHEVAKRLVKNFDVEVLTSKYPGSKNNTVDGIHYKRVGIFAGAKLSQLLFHFTLPKHVLKRNYDIWIESFTPPFSTSLLPLLTKKPVIGLAHMFSGEDMRRKYKLPFNKIEDLGLKMYKYFIVMTDFHKQKVIKINPKAMVQVIPNGIEKPKYKNFRKDDYILFIGRIEVDQKGLDLLMKSIRAVKNIKLKIAGTGNKNDVDKLKLLIKKYGLEKKVELVGRVGGKEKQTLFRKAKLVVSPSRYETFGIVALEAFSYSLPFVCFDIDGYKWLPNNLAIKAKPFSSASLTKSINKLVNNPKLQSSMGKDAYSYVGKFNWDNISKEYEKFITYTIKEHSSKKGANKLSLSIRNHLP
jgi:phosphatidyl-myo-inositol alpha-mannosyltransferase